MSDFGKLVRDLGSPKSSTRYDACEELRVAPSIPSEAIAALEKTLNDPDRLVREAAQSALAVHKPQPKPTPPPAPPTGHQVAPGLSQAPSQPADRPLYPSAAPLATDALLAQMLAEQKEHTRLLRNISTAATMFSLLVLLSLILGFCTALGGGF